MNKKVEDFKVGMKVKAVKGDNAVVAGREYKILENDGSDVPLLLDLEGYHGGWWVSLDQVELIEEVQVAEEVQCVEEEIEPMSVDQLTAFLYGYAHAGGDVTKMVTITFEGDK